MRLGIIVVDKDEVNEMVMQIDQVGLSFNELVVAARIGWGS